MNGADDGACGDACSVPWFEAAFKADYLKRYSHRSHEAARAEGPFLRQALALPPGSRVLDLCCGAGRHSRTLAAMGYRVVGIDLSHDLLTCAQEESMDHIDYVRADMRVLPLENESLDGAVNLFTSFGYFENDAENAGVIAEVARVLKPGAPFVLDFLNLTHTLANLVPQSQRTSGDVTISERRYFDASTKRIVKEIRACEGEPMIESVRGYSPAELVALVENAGFAVSARFGDLLGAPFDEATSPRCVVVARFPLPRGERADVSG